MRIKISENLENELMTYINLLGSKVFDGITYLALKNNNNNKAKINTCNKVWESVRADGFSENMLFRRSYVDNDIIFDLDLNVCLALGNKLLKKNLTMLGLENLNSQIEIINKPAKNIRKLEMERLLKYLGDNATKDSLDFILYSQEKHTTVSILGVYKGKEHMLVYTTFRLRHWDLADINTVLYEKYDRCIDTLNICEIIDNVGLRVTVTFKKGGSSDC